MEDFERFTPSSRPNYNGDNPRLEYEYINKYGTFASKETSEINNSYFDCLEKIKLLERFDNYVFHNECDEIQPF